jgi:hypothetical protein
MVLLGGAEYFSEPRSFIRYAGIANGDQSRRRGLAIVLEHGGRAASGPEERKPKEYQPAEDLTGERKAKNAQDGILN